MSEFDEWFKSLNEGGRATYFLGQEGNISKEAWNHQQAKIDELQARIDEAIERSGHAHIGYPMLSRQFDDVLKILKGNKDEK